MTPEQIFMLMQMQQAGKVAPTPTPKIAQGPTPVQIKPSPEIQIQQKPQTEAEKFKQAAKMAALNAGMNNAFQAGATAAAVTNPMAAPLAFASMFLKEGDKVPDYEQKTFRGEPIDWSNPWEYVGMDKMTAAEIAKEEIPSSGFSTKFARKKGGQDFSTEGPGVGYDTYIPELDMNNWQKYGYDYGRIKEMFLDNPYNRTSENYQAFLWSHMTPAQRLKAMQEGGVLSNWAIQDYLKTGKDESWKRYVPQNISMDDDDVTYTPVPGGHLEHFDGSTIYFPRTWYGDPLGMSTLRDALNRHNNYIIDLPGYHSKGNKVKKPRYYAEGDQIHDLKASVENPEESNMPIAPLGSLQALRTLSNMARGYGVMGPYSGSQWTAGYKYPAPKPLSNMDYRSNLLNKIEKFQPSFSDPAAKSANAQLKDILENRIHDRVYDNDLGPSKTPFEKHLDKMMNDMSDKQYDRFMKNWKSLDREGQMKWLEAREADFEFNENNKKMKKYVKSLETENAVRKDLEKASNVKAQLYTEDGKPVKGSDLMSKDLENYTSKWNQFKRGLAKFAAPLTGPFAGPLAAIGTVLDTQPLNVDETPEAVQKARELQAAAYKDGPIIPKEEQEYLMRKAFIEENNPQPVYKQHGGGALEKVLNYIPEQYKYNEPTAFTAVQPFMDQPYFQNVDSGSDNNPSFTDQVMGGNVNLWGPLSLDWNHGFGGQVGLGMDVPIMGGKPQWQ